MSPVRASPLYLEQVQVRTHMATVEVAEAAIWTHTAEDTALDTVVLRNPVHLPTATIGEVPPTLMTTGKCPEGPPLPYIISLSDW